MIKDVIISIESVQSADGESDSVSFATEGRYGFQDGKYFLSYEEGKLFENANVKTKAFINTEKSVVLQRKGDITSRMEITEGERNTCFYATPIGEISIAIYGESVDISLDQKGGEINLVYTIDSGLKLISKNKVKITVKEV